VDEVLRSDEAAVLAAEYGRASVTDAVRAELQSLRMKLGQGRFLDGEFESALGSLAASLRRRLESGTEPSLRRVINAAGVLIHTNLGRAPLAREAAEQAATVATAYSNLEFDLTEGQRGRRDDHAQRLFEQLFAREGLAETSTLVVNNNAAAVFLALAAMAEGGEVVVSRGELVEIGGSFRIPEIMARSGASLCEVGTTNRTRIEDYERAIGERTRLLLRVHRSNFEIVGFTDSPTLGQLVELGQRRGIPVLEDLGSGALARLDEFGVSGEPTVQDSLRAGVSLVTYSGDKLLGGPQAGLITGEPGCVARLRQHPLFRTLRVDKMCYAALEATLAAYLREDYDALPLLRMMRTPAESVRARCQALLPSAAGLRAEVVATETMIGGGAAPGKSLPSFALALSCEAIGATKLALRLRQQKVPVVARIKDDWLLLDLRTVDPEDDAYLAQTLAGIIPG